MKFITGNKRKAANSAAAGLSFSGTLDKEIPEILSDDPVMVALHKSYDAGPGTIIEDSSLLLGQFGTTCGEIGPLLKYKIRELHNYHGRRARFAVCLGENDGQEIRIYAGMVSGVIDAPISYAELHRDDPSLSEFDYFDLVFYVEDSGSKSRPIADLKGQLRSDPRMLAARYFKERLPHKVFRVEEVSPWTGQYQP